MSAYERAMAVDGLANYISTIVAQAMNAAGLDADRIAEQTGMKPKRLHRMLDDCRRMDTDTLAAIMYACGRGLRIELVPVGGNIPQADDRPAADPIGQAPPRIQIAVLHHDHTFTYYPANGGWHVDNPSRCIVVGRGVPRTYVPLDSVRSFAIEQVAPRTAES